MTQLTGCVRTEIRYVNTPPVPVPAGLLAECPIPQIPDAFTWGDSLELNEKLLTALMACNRDKTALRKIESLRAADLSPEISH